MKFSSIFLAFVYFPGLLFAQQEVDTLLLLPQVLVSESLRISREEGRDWERTDSSMTDRLALQNLGDLLAAAHTVFVKNYGPSGISSSSIRGGSASHTAILWNGVNIQNPMLGQTDLSLFPVALADDILWSPGGAATANIQGALGGAIQMKNSFDQHAPRLMMQNAAGSFGAFTNAARLQYGQGKVTGITRIYYHQAKNDFPYLDLHGIPQKVDHGQLKQWGIIQEARFSRRPGSEWDVHLWQQHSYRQLPANRLQLKSVAGQEDNALRTILKWKKWTDKHAFSVTAAYLSDQLNYRDTIAGIQSESQSNTLSIKGTEQFYTAFGSFDLSLGYQRIRVNSNNYDFMPLRNAWSANMAFRKTGKSQKWCGEVRLAASYADGYFQPLLPALILKWMPNKWLTAKTSMIRNFRLPTFNDLYWVPGGNPELKPERSWSYEAGIIMTPMTKKGKATYGGSLTGFFRSVDNWILWLPGTSVWSPENARSVWSRGLEAESHVKKEAGKWLWKIDARYSFIRSTNVKAADFAQATLGKQLIYQPAHTGGASLLIRYHQITLFYAHRWSGALFTTSDNSQSLGGYSVGDMHVDQMFKFNRNTFTLSATVFNCWNKNYEVVEYYPMPGRHFQLKISTNLQ